MDALIDIYYFTYQGLVPRPGVYDHCNDIYSPVVEGFFVEKNSTKITLVPLDAEFSTE